MSLDPISAVAGAVGRVATSLDALFTSDHELSREETRRLKEAVKLDLAEAANAAAQIQVNSHAARHPSLFVAGARPAVLWVFVVGMAWNTILGPFLNWIATLAGADATLPILPTEALWPIVSGVLGLGGWRAWEKTRGVARENMKATPWVLPRGEVLSPKR